MEIVSKRIHPAHTKPRINAKAVPKRLVWGEQDEGSVLPLLGNEDYEDDIKYNLPENVSQPGRGELLVIHAFSPCWGQRKVGFLSRAV